MHKAEITLNEAQAQVVANKTWPLLVVAGAGTGKTRVIVEKINALLNSGVEPHRILALTFTEKAAAEMLDRVLERRSGFELDMPILTFNAYGEQLLREFSADSDLSSNFRLLGDSAKIVFLRQHLEALELDYFSPVSNPEGQLPDIADYFSKLKQYVITPETYEAFVKTMPQHDEAQQLEHTKHQELARAYTNYLELCKKINVIDYDDQIYQVVQLLKARPNVLKLLQARYHTILVDEFQDTNPMQSELINLLTTNQTELMVVGDDDQSIYGFRGATLANILGFKKQYSKSSEITLTENYRSSKPILEAAYQLIQNNNPHRLEASLGINKKLSAHAMGPDPQLECFTSLSEELQWLASNIADQLKHGASPGEIAVLCRRNATARQVSEALSLGEIDHVVIGEKYQLYKTPIVRSLNESLKAITDPAASVSLYHTLSGGLFQISPSQLATFASQARHNHQSLEAYLNDNQEDVEADINAAVQQILAWREQAAVLTVGQLVYKVLEESGLKDRLYEQAGSDPNAALTVTQLSQFFNTLKEFEQIATQPTALQYLESLPVLEAAGQTDEDGTLELSSSKVNVLTVHKAKGLEWETVYIPDCTEGSFPMRQNYRGIAMPEALIAQWQSPADEHSAEERRLMYVAVTRAKRRLVLSYAQKHHTPTPRKPSRFVTELFNDLPLPASPNPNQQSLDFQLLAKPSAPAATVPLPSSMQYRDTIRLSVSQITTYLNCPLDFYYRYILGVPEPPNHAASYGSAIHTVIEAFNKGRLEGIEVGEEDLLQVLEENWKNEGYISAEHAQRAKAQARNTISNFLKYHADTPVPSRVEWPFSLRLETEKLTIVGRLDAVFETEDGVEIRDYKTSSSVTTPEKAKRRAASSDQLTLYALIWQAQTNHLPSTLSLEFVDTNQLGTVKKTQRGIDTMQRKLQELAQSIRAGSFKPGTSHDYCQHPPLN